MHKDSKLRLMTNAGKSRIVKVIFLNIHIISDACANSLGRYIMIAQFMGNVFILNSSFSGKVVFLRKLKLIYPSTTKHYIICSVPTFLILFKKVLAPPPFKKEDRDYAFYMRDYKGETKLFYIYYIIIYISVILIDRFFIYRIVKP